ncbi:MAG TPA: S8 family serine peptidase [Thermoanaerobaculia bacterium]|nr:S8 family serine peptidase [Thermoanaerobaculia bacterium]
MKRTLLSLLVLSLALPALAAGPKKAKMVKADRPIPDHYIVVLEDRVENANDVADEMVSKARGRKDHVYEHALKGFSARMSARAAEELANDPRVKYVEEDGVVSINATQSNATWGLDRVDQRDLPLNSTYVYNATGAGVKAYIIDTGINTAHVDFGGRAIDGYDAVDNALPAADCNGHGTHVAGTVGGSTWGVAKGVTLVAVRVLDCSGNGTNAGVIAGINWVASNHAAGQPAVANMSLGGGASTAVDDAVNAGINDGVTFAVAAGNGDIFGNPQPACNYSPARVPNAITVGSTTSTDARSSFSNYGPCLDIFAPGSSITSAWYSSNTATNTISGTSMATPHVAGAAALYLQGNTSASPATVASALINNSTLNKVTNPLTGSANRLLYTGFIGGGGGTPAPAISSFSPTSGGVGTTVTINGSNFTGATSVSFNNQSASFSVVSSSQITASVPNCSSSGLVRVTTAGGTAASSGSFTVTGCGGGSGQLLLNPGFESGNNGQWTQTAGVIDSSTSRPSRTGAWKAWLCGYGTTHTDYVYQSVTIPSTAASATLSFWVRIDSAETTTSVVYDRLQVQISTNGGSTYTTLATYSNLNKNSTYVQKVFDLSAYRGATVRVRLYATEDSSLQTSFVVDDTALNYQ